MILWTIIKLTCKSALRSHIFQLLLVILILCIFIVPNTISGDGTAEGFIQISLKYSITIIAFILSLSTIWLSCYSITSDIESYQIHMVISKPASRIKIWLGKCLGVLLINFILLLISSTIIYSLIMWQLYNQSFTEKSKDRIENEVLVARRVFMPDLPNLDKLADAEIKRRLKLAEAKGSSKNLSFISSINKEKIKREITLRLGEVRAGYSRPWQFSNVHMATGKTITLRYRAYIGKVSTKEQRETFGLWKYVVNKKSEDDGSIKRYKQSSTRYPEKLMCGSFREKEIPASCVSKDNQVDLLFTNYDLAEKTLYFQSTDGPKLLVNVSSFFDNYCRAILIIFIKLMILAGISCAAASFLSMPTAILSVISYLILGSISNYILGTGIGTELNAGFMDALANSVSHVLNLIVIPMQEFEITTLLASGELIEFSLIFTLFLKYFIIKGIPIFALGIFIYNRREMGLVIKNG